MMVMKGWQYIMVAIWEYYGIFEFLDYFFNCEFIMLFVEEHGNTMGI